PEGPHAPADPRRALVRDARSRRPMTAHGSDDADWRHALADIADNTARKPTALALAAEPPALWRSTRQNNSEKQSANNSDGKSKNSGFQRCRNASCFHSNRPPGRAETTTRQSTSRNILIMSNKELSAMLLWQFYDLSGIVRPNLSSIPATPAQP